MTKIGKMILEDGIEIGMEKGMQKGMERGMERGMQKGMLQIAEKMLELGKTTKEIQEITGLSLDDLEKIRLKKLNVNCF